MTSGFQSSLLLDCLGFNKWLGTCVCLLFSRPLTFSNFGSLWLLYSWIVSWGIFYLFNVLLLLLYWMVWFLWLPFMVLSLRLVGGIHYLVLWSASGFFIKIICVYFCSLVDLIWTLWWCMCVTVVTISKLLVVNGLIYDGCPKCNKKVDA